MGFKYCELRNFSTLHKKIFQRKFMICDTLSRSDCKIVDRQYPRLRCWFRKELFPQRYLRSRHCFVDSSMLKWTTIWWYGVNWINWPGLYAIPILYYACSMCMQEFVIISTKSSEITIGEKLDPRKFSPTLASFPGSLHTWAKNWKERGEPGKINHMRNIIAKENWLDVGKQMNLLTLYWQYNTCSVARKLYGWQNGTRQHYITLPGSMASYGERTQTHIHSKITLAYLKNWLLYTLVTK